MLAEAEDGLFVCQRPAWEVGQTGSPVTAIEYSGDGWLVAFANAGASVTVAQAYDGTVVRNPTQQYTSYAVASCKFHPNDRNLLLVAHKDGYMFLHNLEKGEVQGMSRHLGNSLISMSVDPFGDTFAIACADGSIRIYDMESLQRTKALIKVGSRVGTNQTVQTYAMMFHPDDPNIVVSATGNDRVLIWDVRTGGNERQISGPHMRGQALDMYDGKLVTGSYRDRKQIEVWDFGTGKCIRHMSTDAMFSEKDLMVTAMRVARNGLDLVAGGSGANLSQALDFEKGLFLGQSKMGQSPIVCVAMSPFGAGFVQGNDVGGLECYMIRLRTM